MPSENPATQAEALHRAVEEISRSVEALDEASFLGPLGRWSARDVVAHLIGWNRYTIEGAKQIAKGELPFYDVDPGKDFANVNRTHVRDYPSREPSVLLAELRKSARELSEFLGSLDSDVWSADHGVHHWGEKVTIRSTVHDLIVDYLHHREQIEGLRSRPEAASLPPGAQSGSTDSGR